MCVALKYELTILNISKRDEIAYDSVNVSVPFTDKPLRA